MPTTSGSTTCVSRDSRRVLNLGARSSCHRPFWGRWQRARTASARALLVASLLGVVAASAPHAARVAAVGPQSAAAAGDPVIVAAGDIACDPTNSNFNSGNGKNDACQQKWTYNLFAGGGAAAVLLLGDNQYYCGGLQRVPAVVRPQLGPAEVDHPPVGRQPRVPHVAGGDRTAIRRTPAPTATSSTSAPPPGTQGQGYYSYDVGTWHLIALNSNCSDAGGCGADQPAGQVAEERPRRPTRTAARSRTGTSRCSARAAGLRRTRRPVLDALYDNNADLVLTGHDHIVRAVRAADARTARSTRSAGSASSSSEPAARTTRRSRGRREQRGPRTTPPSASSS